MKARAILREADAHRRNKTEEAFWQMQLLRKRADEILECHWEPFNLRLADKTYYKPDCLVIENDGTMTLYEVKGFFRDDARVKVKVAARLFPYFRIIVATWPKKQWRYELVSPPENGG